jgi:hypothetical protein
VEINRNMAESLVMTFKQAMFISTVWRKRVMVLEQLPGRLNDYNKIAP